MTNLSLEQLRYMNGLVLDYTQKRKNGVMSNLWKQAADTNLQNKGNKQRIINLISIKLYWVGLNDIDLNG